MPRRHLHTKLKLTWGSADEMLPSCGIWTRNPKIASLALCLYLWVQLWSCFREFTAIKGELLPYLVRRQFRRPRDNKQEQFNEDETSSVKQESGANLGAVFLAYRTAKLVLKLEFSKVSANRSCVKTILTRMQKKLNDRMQSFKIWISSEIPIIAFFCGCPLVLGAYII